MSILIKAGAGLVAGVVAGGLGLAFLPQVEPNTVKPRQAVGRPQFIVAEGAEPKTQAVAVSAIAVEPAKAAPPAPKPAPPSPKPAPPSPKPEANPEIKAAVAPSPSPIQVAKADPPSAAGATRGISLDMLDPPKSTPAPLAPETRAAPPSGANAAAARWSVQGLVALAKGDLSCARLYLARAAEAGDPRAFVALADTYDPAMLARLGVVGAPGDTQRARDYLVKASAAGVVVSKDRMAALEQAPSSVR